MQLTVTRRTFSQGAAVAVALAVVRRPALARAGTNTHEVRIDGFAFAPADPTVAPGDVVVWRNADLAPHTVSAVNGDWDTGEIAGGEAMGVRFEEPGEHRYFCAFHPQMTGRIRVAPPD